MLYRPSAAAASPSLSEWNGTCVDDVVQVFAMKYHLIKSMWSAGHLPNDEDEQGWMDGRGGRQPQKALSDINDSIFVRYTVSQGFWCCFWYTVGTLQIIMGINLEPSSP